MPGFNQKGPMGQGPMSGKKMGKCTNFGANAKQETSAVNTTTTTTETSTENNTGRGFGFGKGMGQGRGMGMGRQHRFRNGQ